MDPGMTSNPEDGDERNDEIREQKQLGVDSPSKNNNGEIELNESQQQEHLDHNHRHHHVRSASSLHDNKVHFQWKHKFKLNKRQESVLHTPWKQTDDIAGNGVGSAAGATAISSIPLKVIEFYEELVTDENVEYQNRKTRTSGEFEIDESGMDKEDGARELENVNGSMMPSFDIPKVDHENNNNNGGVKRKHIRTKEKLMTREQLLIEARRHATYNPVYDAPLKEKRKITEKESTSNATVESIGDGEGDNDERKSQNSDSSSVDSDNELSKLQGVILARDLHMLDPKISLHGPSFAVRRNAILINLEPINAIILSDKLFVLVPPEDSDIINSSEELDAQPPEEVNEQHFKHSLLHMRIMSKLGVDAGKLDRPTKYGEKLLLSTWSQADNHHLLCDYIREKLVIVTSCYEDAPFELRVLEALLTVLCDDVNSSVNELKHMIPVLVETTRNGIPSIELLKQIKIHVEKCKIRVLGLISAFESILEETDSLVLMHLTMLRHNPDRYHTLKSRSEAESYREYEDVEILLDSYLQALETSLAKAQIISKDLETIESLTLIRLDEARNQLMRIEIVFACVTAICAFSAMVAGVFGMNLKSDVEEDDYWFWSIAGTLLIGTPLLTATSFTYMSSRGILFT